MDLERSVNGGSSMALKEQNKNSLKGKRKSSTANRSLKVVYISSPMKVKTSASRFRSLVQELTGKNSDISRYMDGGSNFTGGGGEFLEEGSFYGGGSGPSEKMTSEGWDGKLSPSASPGDTPTSSDSFLETQTAMAGVFFSEMEQFEKILFADSFYGASEMDFLGSFEELL